MIKRILVALGGTPFSSSEIRYAVELARIHKAEITGVTVVDTDRLAYVGPVPVGGGPAAHELREHRMRVTTEHVEEAIVAFQQECEKAKCRSHVVRETGHAFEELTSLWRYHDLTISGLRGLFEYGVLHDPDDELRKLIAKGVRPILAVSESYREPRSALVAYNGTLQSAKAMKRFVQMQPWPGIRLSIVSFGQSDEAKALLHPAQDYCEAHGYQTEVRHVDGSPSGQMLDVAHEMGSDLIVMGAAGRSMIAKLVLGDTVRNLLRTADIPLFLTQ